MSSIPMIYARTGRWSHIQGHDARSVRSPRPADAPMTCPWLPSGEPPRPHVPRGLRTRLASRLCLLRRQRYARYEVLRSVWRSAVAAARLAGPLRLPSRVSPRASRRAHLELRRSPRGDRKQVTLWFADLKGSMELLADRDPEEARRILYPPLERMMEAVQHYAGTVNHADRRRHHGLLWRPPRARGSRLAARYGSPSSGRSGWPSPSCAKRRCWPNGSNDDHRRGRVCAFMTTAYNNLGELEEALGTGERALEIAHRLGDLRPPPRHHHLSRTGAFLPGRLRAWLVALATHNLAALPAD